ncbi:MAG TPA: hypothetical protein VH143_26515 [Kofleriaceae bacterium]|jgi:hypothetical protein|nr:hypothetical protein [Kofleriaceae bacterium]
MRSVLVIAFIAAVAAGAAYLARRPTIARGDVIAADLLAKNKATIRALACDPEIPITVAGARFSCDAELASGERKHLQLELDRNGAIREVGEAAPAADPWR